jgi:hypothetical protein
MTWVYTDKRRSCIPSVPIREIRGYNYSIFARPENQPLLAMAPNATNVRYFVMTAPIPEMSAALVCHRCGYDLRAHPRDGICPECAASVAESIRLAAIPRRPAWRNSDPRWRRRMLAGVWILVLLPLMDALRVSEWASSIRVPNVFGFPGAVCTLDETFLCNKSMRAYPLLLFCIGVVLLFSRERGRQRSRLDCTRRWGVLCSYVTLLLGAAPILFISALVLVGISALFMSMPLKYQPGETKLFVNVGSAYLRYGLYPKDITSVVLITFSSITILLACVPLFDALRSSGPKWPAIILLVPLTLFSLMNVARAGQYCFGFSSVSPSMIYRYELYFRPDLLVENIAALPAGLSVSELLAGASLMEIAKWCIVLTIAVWLSIAQFAACWHGGKARVK